MKLDLPQLIKEQHAAMKAKGFWDEPRPLSECLMLIISEVGECLEAHRAGMRADFPAFQKRLDELDNSLNPEAFSSQDEIKAHRNQVFTDLFRSKIRGTVEEELADVVLRLADTAGGFEIEAGNLSGVSLPNKTFGEYLFTITKLVIAIDDEDAKQKQLNLVWAVALIQALANQEGIDLQKAIDLKVRYNSQRERLHGKAY